VSTYSPVPGDELLLQPDQGDARGRARVTRRLEKMLGTPVEFEVLKNKEGRRRTLRARGPLGRAIVKVYASERAPVVAGRVDALALGPEEPLVPRVLFCDRDLHLVVLSEVPGRSLREALLDGDRDKASRAGVALGRWHAAWAGMTPHGLRLHTHEREMKILLRLAESAEPELASAVREAGLRLASDWTARTVVHRDLYEEQVILGERVGLIDLDDAALGPPELDVGNLIAHVDLLSRRSSTELADLLEIFVESYALSGPRLDPGLLSRCRGLALLRLACIHSRPDLVEPALGGQERPPHWSPRRCRETPKGA